MSTADLMDESLGNECLDFNKQTLISNTVYVITSVDMHKY